MKNLLIEIVARAKTLKPEYGEYTSHKTDQFTHGINVFTSTNYTLGVSQELIYDFENGLVNNSSIVNRLKIKNAPKKQ